MPETVLVTGATGFIGAALCRALLAQGHSVQAFHRPTSDRRSLDGLDVVHHLGDILRPETLAPAMRGVDWVFHLAAEAAYWRNPDQVIETAVQGTQNVVLAARAAGVRRVVMTSSLAALGVPSGAGWLDEQHTFNLPPGRFPYGFAKHQSEQEALRIAEGLPEVVIVNPSAVFGPGDRKPISGSLIIEAARGLGFVYVDGGWNVVHIDDVIRGHLAAAQLGRAGERYLLGGENLTHRETLEIIAQVVGRRPPWLRLPGWSVPPLAALIDGLRSVVTLPMDGNQLRLSRHRLFCDLSKSRRELGMPEPIPFRQAVHDFWDWYRSPTAV
ncbi:MAG: NAD-dependent epimerase/dehydratase family protein [Anaerolineales bacterium]|nr:NAD-dependent epimerase/dehydratase family protein [Anaerolineales bacterium]